jgi:hypothetical protein
VRGVGSRADWNNLLCRNCRSASLLQSQQLAESLRVLFSMPSQDEKA